MYVSERPRSAVFFLGRCLSFQSRSCKTKSETTMKFYELHFFCDKLSNYFSIKGGNIFCVLGKLAKFNFQTDTERLM